MPSDSNCPVSFASFADKGESMNIVLDGEEARVISPAKGATITINGVTIGTCEGGQCPNTNHHVNHT